MKLKIRVANPASGNLTYISREAAQRYVTRGRARWKNERVIQFLETHTHASATEDATLVSRVGYDRIGRMTAKQIAGIPIVDAQKLLAI